MKIRGLIISKGEEEILNWGAHRGHFQSIGNILFLRLNDGCTGVRFIVLLKLCV